MEELLNKCIMCPRECKVNRNNNELGFCMASNKIKIGGYHLHLWEEPIITGEKGSGTIFFSHCNLSCIYCQNYKISKDNIGEEITNQRLADIMLELQEKGASNINLVTPTHYIPQIKTSLILAKERGLFIPIVYNTSCYEKVESLKLLEGLIDIYLPDFKYFDNNLGKYSKVNNYFEVASLALEEMVRQVGKQEYDEKGNLKKGIIVRHLILPSHSEDSKKIIEYLYRKYKNTITYSIMNQYTPIKKLEFNNLNRRLTSKEYDDVINFAYDIGIRNSFMQDKESQEESFIPIFKGDNWI